MNHKDTKVRPAMGQAHHGGWQNFTVCLLFLYLGNRILTTDGHGWLTLPFSEKPLRMLGQQAANGRAHVGQIIVTQRGVERQGNRAPPMPLGVGIVFRFQAIAIAIIRHPMKRLVMNGGSDARLVEEFDERIPFDGAVLIED